MKRIFVCFAIAVALTSCKKVREPDVIEVLHSQPMTDEYVVSKGDTLNTIANRFNMDVERLIAVNNIQKPDFKISVGQVLKVDSKESDTIIVKQIFYK